MIKKKKNIFGIPNIKKYLIFNGQIFKKNKFNSHFNYILPKINT